MQASAKHRLNYRAPIPQSARPALYHSKTLSWHVRQSAIHEISNFDQHQIACLMHPWSDTCKCRDQRGSIVRLQEHYIVRMSSIRPPKYFLGERPKQVAQQNSIGSHGRRTCPLTTSHHYVITQTQHANTNTIGILTISHIHFARS